MKEVQSLAKGEGRRLKYIESREDANPDLPYFEVIRNTHQHYEIKSYNHASHPNSDRMHFITSYLQHRIFPSMIGDMSGVFQIELHDVYDKEKTDFSNTLVWSKIKGDTDVVLMPDLYHLCNFFGKLDDIHKDTSAYADKNDRICFFGSSTGSTEITKNERVRGCTWASTNADIADFFITRKVQMSHECVIPRNIMCPLVAQKKLFDYKFCCDIKGNTNCWDRVPVIMASNSLLFKMPCEFMSFYEPLLDERSYVQIDNYCDLRHHRSFFLANQKISIDKIKSCNGFAEKYFNSNVAEYYLKNMFQEYLEQR